MLKLVNSEGLGFRLWRDVGMSRKAIKPLQRLKGSSCLQKSSNLHSVVKGLRSQDASYQISGRLAERFITATATDETKKEFKVSAFLISQLRNVAAKERELEARLQRRG